MIKYYILVFMILLFIIPLISFCGTPTPEIIPLCQEPQNIAPAQNFGIIGINYYSPIVWNGKDFACVAISGQDGNLYFRRFFADGTPVSDPIALFYVGGGIFCSLVWNGNGYGVTYISSDGTYSIVKFHLLSVEGLPIGNEVQVSNIGEEPILDCYSPKIAFGGGEYAIVWQDKRSGISKIYATLLNSDGTIANGGASHDIVMCDSTFSQGSPDVIYSQTQGRFYVVWNESRTEEEGEIYGSELHPLGITWCNSIPIVSSTGYPRRCALTDSGTYIGMVFEDKRSEIWQIYFCLVDPRNITKVKDEVCLSNSIGRSLSAKIIWTGGEYGVFWNDNSSGITETFFQRVNSSGIPQGSNWQVGLTDGLSSISVSFAKHGYLLGGVYVPSFYLFPIGCASIDTPTCPGGFVAYNITGTSATIGWLPSSDQNLDIAYYQVYRNAIPIAKTSETFFHDTNLQEGVTYAYAVEPVNGAQIQNTNCQTTFYVKTNSNLILKLEKQDNKKDLKLFWNDGSIPNYNIFRGTSPQVLHSLGSASIEEFIDKDVLVDSNIYFYSVDEPTM